METVSSVEAKLREELRVANEKLRGSEQEKRRLQDRNEELQLALEEVDKDAREAEALNGHLQRRVDEMEVQIAALRQYETEFDLKVTKMLDERDEALTVAAKDKEAILLKVKELQEELALSRTPEGLADATELAMMLKERQLEIEDLLDRNEELEEDLAKVREELEQFRRSGGGTVPRPPPGDPSGPLGIDGSQQYEDRLRNLKADALEKDARLLDAEKKLEQLAKGIGAQALLAENRQLTRDNADMKRQVGEAKRDLSSYLSEAASIVYENDLLRSIANVKPEELKLKDFKLKDKVTSAKAMAAAKQLEKEVSELESERTKLKLRLRQLSELAAEKVSLLHDLQPEQMLQLEEIAARMRQGKLELPLDDQSRQLKEERDELKKRLSMKDQDIAQHVDRKVEEVLKKQGVTKDLEAKIAAFEKDNEMLKSSLEAYRAAYADLAGGAVADPQGILRPVPRPPGAPGVPRPPPAPGHQFGLAAPAVLPRIPGMQPVVWSSLLQAGLQLPAELADGAPETVCSLYCQVIEAMEELSRERQLRQSLGEEVAAFQVKYDRLLAEQEVLYKDYFAQKDQWLAEKKDLEERLQVQSNLLMDSMKKCDVLEEQLKIWQRLDVGGPEATLREELMNAMTRLASLEQHESVLSRKYETEKQNHATVKDAFDTMQKDFLEREGFLKERLSKAVLWKRRSANALRIARKKIQSMVAGSDFERTQQQLQVCRQREFDLSRRQTELTMKVSQQEDKLRDMMDIQDRCRTLDHLVRETEQEFTVLRRRLQQKEPRFAAECALFARLTVELQRTLGFVGSFEAASRALSHAEARVLGESSAVSMEVTNVEVSLDEKLRKLDSNNDGFISLVELRRFFEGLSIKIKDEEMQLLADALHPSVPILPPLPAPPGGPPAPPGPPDVPAGEASSVSVLGIVGRFRLFGLRALEPEELFWCAVQAHLLRRPDQPSAAEVLRSNFQRLRNAEGHIAATDVLQLLTQFEVTPNQLPLRSLRRVLTWLGVEARSLEELLPVKTLPGPGDPQEPEFRLKLQSLRIVYADFAERFERGLSRAMQQLRPVEADVVAPSLPVMPPAPDVDARQYAARARESAANRRCVVLEQEVRTKDRIVRELQRQVGELEGFLERMEAEVYEERSSKVRLMAQLDESLPKAEVEPKLRQIEELRFQVDQSSLALKQAKDLARTCAGQSESYEKLLKRRQQEVRHLQESVKFLQATDEMSNTVGKLQYRLLLSQWEKGNLQRQLQAAVQDLRDARRDVLENEEQVEQERQQHDDTEEQLQQQLLVLKAQTAKLQDENTAAMPIDKARQLTSRLEEISSRKMELEERLSKVRLELLRNQAESDECRLKAQQAQELMKELKALEKSDDDAPRQRLLEMAKKLADSKLKELQHKRSLEIAQEQQQQLEKARKADEKEIQNLQREVAEAESKLASQELQWRAKVMEAQGVPKVSGVRRASQATIETLEQMQAKVTERDARISVLEADLEKSKGDKENAVAEERMKVRKLEIELNLLSDGDTLKLRHQLRSEHDAEVQQISQAAEASVQTLQELLDQTEERLRQQQLEMAQLHEKHTETQQKHSEETRQLGDEIERLRKELVEAKHQHGHDVDAAARLAPLPPDESARLAESFGSEQGENFGQVESRLREHQDQVLTLYHRLEQQQEEFNSLLDQQFTEAKQREDQLREHQLKMQQEFQAREQRLLDQHEAQRQQRDMELQRIQQELAALRSSKATQGSQQLQEQVAEAQKHASLALKHNEQLEEHRLSAEQWQQHAKQLEQKKVELEQELQGEREKHKDSHLRKQQAQLRKQLAQKEVQLSSLKKAVEELKDRVVQLSIRNEREELESGNARRAETEVRKRISGQEEKMQYLKDQVARLSKQLQEAKQLQNQDAYRTAEMDVREADLEKLLQESAKELEMKAAEAKRLETELQRQQWRCAESEAALKAERGVLEGETRLVKRQGEEALESNARRVAALLDRIEVLQAERTELSAKLQGAEVALARRGPGTPRSTSPENVVVQLAEMKERLQRERDLRQSLQQEVRDLSVQLEVGRRQEQTLDPPVPTGTPPVSPAPSVSRTSPVNRGGSSRSPAPRSLRQARCGQLQAEVAQLKAKSKELEEENDDLKLRLASEGERGAASEVDILRGSLESANARNRALVTEVEVERLRHRARADVNPPNQGAVPALDALRIQQLTQECSLLQRRVDELQRDNLQLQLGGTAQREQAAQLHRTSSEEMQLQRTALEQQQQFSQEKINSLQRRIDDLVRENIQLQRATGVPVEHQLQLRSLQDKNYALEAQLNEMRARERIASPSPPPVQGHLLSPQGETTQLQERVDELVRENFLLQRQGATSSVSAEQRVHELQARVDDLLRENLQLRSSPSTVLPMVPVPVSAVPPSSPPPPEQQQRQVLAAAQQQVMQLQAHNQQLQRENLELQQVQQGERNVAAAKRHAADLQARVDELLRENAQLQLAADRSRASPQSAAPGGAIGLGSPGVVSSVERAEDLGEMRRLHGEVASQRRVLDRMVQQLSSDAGVSAFELLVEECQRLFQRIGAMNDENAVLKVRAGDVPKLPQNLQEAHEVNAVLRSRLDNLSAELAATTTWKEEAAKRLSQQATEIEQLQQRLATLAGSPETEVQALEEALRPPEDQLRHQLERSERQRSNIEKFLAAQTSRVAQLSADLEELQQRLREVTFSMSDVVAPPEAVVRERIRMEYEEHLRQQAVMVQNAEEEVKELRKTNEKLQGQVEQQVRLQVDLTRQLEESRFLGDGGSVAPGMEEVANRLAKRNEELAEENAKLQKDLEQLQELQAEEEKRQTDLGQADLQAKRAQALEMVKNRAPRMEGAPWNPLRDLKDVVMQKEERGEEGVLRRMVKLFDHDRSLHLSLPMFKAILADQLGNLDNEKTEYAEYIFQALDDDADGIVAYQDFEKAVLGQRGPLNEILLGLAQALQRANLRLPQLVSLHDETNDGEVSGQELVQIFQRIQYRLRDGDLSRLMVEFDTGRHSISVAELQFRLEAARVDDILGELKASLARYGCGALLQTFVDADDGSGRFSFSQLEGVFLRDLKLPLSREKLQELFDIFNTDHSGRIPYTELLNRCGLAQSQHLQGVQECLPPADRPRWLENSLAAIKRAVLRLQRDEERFSDAAMRLFSDFDERKAGSLSLAQLRRALVNLGLSGGQREMERLCEQLRGVNLPRDSRGARGGPRGAQQGLQRASRLELRIDNLISRLQSIRIPEEDESARRLEALPVAKVLWSQLQQRNLSLLKILDPDMHGKISFTALKKVCQRYQLGLEEQDFARLAMALAPDRHQRFSTAQLQRLLKNAEVKMTPTTEKAGIGGNLTSAIQGHGQALEAVPKPSGRSASQERRLDGAVEARHRRKVDQLEAALVQSQEERARLERELETLRREELTRHEDPNPRPLNVLLSAGEQAPPLVKELKLEVKGTRELRDKIYALETELETSKRRLEVDARQQLEKEQHRVKQQQIELEEKERSISELIFDLRRARQAAGEGDWAQREEEYMRLHLQLKRLEEELQTSRRNEQQNAERLLDAEHQILELRFEREQVQHRSSRLETRILELELVKDDASPRRPEGPPAAAAAKLQTRKERNLENVIEGLERVIHQQKGDIQRLRIELERRPERKGDIEKLRRRVQELEQSNQDLPRAGLVDELRQALVAKEERVVHLEHQLQQLRENVHQVDAGPSSEDVSRLQQEVLELRRARGEDAAALDEAQRALHEAERTEQRYLEVARENRKLRQDLSALEDEGFWQEIETLTQRNEQAITLVKESKEALERMAPVAAMDVSSLVARLDVFAAPAA